MVNATAYPGKLLRDNTWEQIGIPADAPDLTVGALFEDQLPIDSYTIEGNEVRLTFKHVGSGLASRDGEALNWFEVSDGTMEGRNRVYAPAAARITGPNTIVLTAEGIDDPTHARFAWHCLARHNLMNEQGLPAVSFRVGEEP